ncbi:MAG: hypothetical protein A3J49_15135 [Gallionellales bacterium RIFCSPHIGHO2_02_FULL_57_16]|nr:MAG: hypothetical protein A3J49_15135 [Gallionellales bacterium RIFCSPHIGHO2_02_FULL_57_16]
MPASFRQYPLFLWLARRVINFAIPMSVGLLVLLCLPAAIFPIPELNRREVLALVILAGVVLFYRALYIAHLNRNEEFLEVPYR